MLCNLLFETQSEFQRTDGYSNLTILQQKIRTTVTHSRRHQPHSSTERCGAAAARTGPQTRRHPAPGIRAAGRTATLVIPVLQGPRHPRFATVLARRTSFDEWPPALKQTPEAMADAGFIYLGLSDQVGGLTFSFVFQVYILMPYRLNVSTVTGG